MNTCNSVDEQYLKNLDDAIKSVKRRINQLKYDVYLIDSGKMENYINNYYDTVDGVMKSMQRRDWCELNITRLESQLEDGSKLEQESWSSCYSWKKNENKKDNDGKRVINRSPYASYSSKIRVPSLKRKSAWKRFYKMYPGLKGLKVIPGKSNCQGVKFLNESTIKLKEV